MSAPRIHQVHGPRVVVFNVAYSENVGDGVIAECMAVALRRRGANVRTIDLSGREDYGERTVRARTLVLAVLAALPAPLRRRIVRWRLERTMRAFEPKWEAALSNADLAVIGGGNLFQDDDLNFPTKIAAAARLCARLGVPVRVHAVGVAGGWSPQARALFGTLDACNVRGVSVRDVESALAWCEEGGPDIPVEIVRDPGLMAATLLSEGGAPRPTSDPSPIVGLGVIHPAVAAHHAHSGAMIGGAPLFVALAETMLAHGWRVRLFSNGARDDQALAARVLASDRLANARENGLIELAERPRSATELTRLVGGLDGLVAHRLHALIVAVGLGVPAIGLPWDDKVRRFHASIGRPEDTALAAMPPDALVELLAHAMRRDPDEAARRRLVREARETVEALLPPLPAAAGDHRATASEPIGAAS